MKLGATTDNAIDGISRKPLLSVVFEEGFFQTRTPERKSLICVGETAARLTHGPKECC